MILSHIRTVHTAATCAASLSTRRTVLRQLSKFGLLSWTSAGSNTDGLFVAPSMTHSDTHAMYSIMTGFSKQWNGRNEKEIRHQFRVLSWYLPWGTEKNREQLVLQDSRLVGRYAVFTDKLFPTFRRRVAPSPSESSSPEDFSDCLTLK